MGRNKWMWAGALVAVLALAPVYALDASNGYELDAASPIVTDSDVQLLSEWSDLDNVGLQVGRNGITVGNDAVAIDSAGRVYAMAKGQTGVDDGWYEGIVRHDGSELETFLQWEGIWEQDASGSWIEDGVTLAIDVTDVYVPSTGLLEERLVLVRTAYDATLDGMVREVIAYELDAGADGSIDGEILWDWASQRQVNVHLAADPTSGDLFILESTFDARTTYDGSIRRFSWSSTQSAYEEQTAVTSKNTAYTDLLFLDGKLYTFDSDSRQDSTRKDTILQVDPTTSDSYADYAYLKEGSDSRPNSYHTWTSDGSSIYAGEYTYSKKNGRQGFVSAVTSGATTSSSNAIATFGADLLWSMDGDVEGSFVLLINNGTTGELEIHILSPSMGGGGDSGGGDTGGGGNGKGKGKNK